MTIDVVRTLYRYSAWATGRILEKAARLRPEELAAHGPYGTTVAHGFLTLSLIPAACDEVMPLDTTIAVIYGLNRVRFPAPVFAGSREFPDVASIRARWDQIENDTQRFVAGLTDSVLAQVLEYRNTRGERWAYPLWQQVVHQVNHATQHRGEVAAALTELGHSPGDLDLLIFIDETEPGR